MNVDIASFALGILAAVFALLVISSILLNLWVDRD